VDIPKICGIQLSPLSRTLILGMPPTLGFYPILSICVFFWGEFLQKFGFLGKNGFATWPFVLASTNERPTIRYVHQVLTGNIKLPPIPFHKPIVSYSTQNEIEFVDMITSSTSNDREPSIKSSSSIHSKLDRSWQFQNYGNFFVLKL